MAIDAETEKQEARKAKRDLLFAVVAAIVVTVLGWYGFGKLSESAKRAGIQRKAPIETVAEKPKTGPIQVAPRAQSPDEPEAVAAALVAPTTPALWGRFVLPPADILLDLARDSIAENDMVTGALLALAALPENVADTPPEIADAAVRVLYDAYLNRREIFRCSGAITGLYASRRSMPRGRWRLRRHRTNPRVCGMSPRANNSPFLKATKPRSGRPHSAPTEAA